MRRKLLRLALATTLLGLIRAAFAQHYVISTIAGAAPPPTPVAGLAVSIRWPTAVAADGAGNLFFESWNCIFRLDAKGQLTRVAGNGTAGYSGDGGPATNAQLHTPLGLAADGQGNLYIADTSNGRVRKVSPDGAIATVAGIGQNDFYGDGGPAASARLRLPSGLTVDRQGNLFIAETGRIRMVSTSGIINTVAGTGTEGYSGDGGLATNAQISPTALAIDGQGTVFLADGYRVRKISPAGIITTVAGNGTYGYSGDGAAATSGQLFPAGVAVDGQGNLFVSDQSSGRIRKISPAGIISTVAGGGNSGTSGDGVPATSTQIDSFGIAIDAQGNLVVADRFNCRVRKISPDGIITTVAGNSTCGYSGDGSPASGAQLLPYAAALDSQGSLFLADQPNHRIRKISRDGIITTVAGNGTTGYSGDGAPGIKAQLDTPWGVATDARGNLFIADSHNHRIRKLATDGTITTFAGTGTQGYSGDGGAAAGAKLAVPSGVAVDAQGNVFIADTANHRVRRVSPDGIIRTVAGNGTAGISGDGSVATSAQVNYPQGLAVDGRGNLFIAEPFDHRVRKLSPDGTMVTAAGTGDFGYSGDGGMATRAVLNNPSSVAVDSQGNLFIADTYNNRIREVGPDGIITTVAGRETCCHSGDGGPATSAELDGPLGIATDAQGNLYVAEGSAIRLLQVSTRAAWVAAVVDAASQKAGPVAPGKMVVLYGSGLGPSVLAPNQAVNGVYSSQLAGTTVFFNGIAAPILYASATQVAAMVPYGITGTTASVTVDYQGQASVPVTLPVATTAPGLFTLDQSGTGLAAAINALIGSINSSANPVKVGNYISLFATGEGQTLPAGVDGRIATAARLPRPVQNVTVTVDGIPAVVQYAGAAPGQVAGVMQVNVQIPAGVRLYQWVPLVLQVGNASTPTVNAVQIAVGGN